MDEHEMNELRAAIKAMDQVVASLKYHNKLNLAWRRMKKAVKPAFTEDQPKQSELFPGNKDV